MGQNWETSDRSTKYAQLNSDKCTKVIKWRDDSLSTDGTGTSIGKNKQRKNIYLKLNFIVYKKNDFKWITYLKIRHEIIEFDGKILEEIVAP